jgi:hypothetical protein
MNTKMIALLLAIVLIATGGTPLYSMQKPTTNSNMEQEKKSVVQKIETMQKAIIGLTVINAASTTFIIGSSITGIAVSLATLIGGAAMIAASAGTATPLVTTEGLIFTSTANLAAAGAVALGNNLLIAGAVAFFMSEGLGALGTVLFGGMTAATLLTAYEQARQIEALEKKYPGVLTKDQKNVVQKFNKLSKGSIGKGIASGIQMKKTQDTIAAQVLSENQNMITALGGEKKAKSFVVTYMKTSRSLINHQTAYQNYQEQKKALQLQRKPYKTGDPKHTKLDLKIAALDLKFAFTKPIIASQEKKLAKMELTYPNLKSIMAPHAQNYITQVDTFIQELARPAK